MYYDEYEHSQYGYDDYPQESYNHNYQPVPDAVRKFIEHFQKCISEGMVYKIQNLYENHFPKLSDTYFEKESWPDEKAIADIVHNDSTFLILYKELYYRHIYAKQPSPSLDQRFSSFYNYCDFFNYILLTETPVQLELPDVWLWELIDEFVYQFTSFTHYRASPNDKKSLEDIEGLKQAQNNKTWDVLCLLNVLHFLVSKSNIKSQLEIQASGGDPDSVAGNFGSTPLYKMLGFYALTGLLRLHCLLGDYYQAIKVLEGVELFKNNEHTRVPGCQISTAYYAGFAYIMMRRYSDAIRTFSSSLLYIQRTKQMFTTKSYQNAQINKQTESMYTLLAICLVLHPQVIDEGLQQALSEGNYNEMYYKMQIGDMDEFKKAFESSCPKFLSLQTPSPENPSEDFTKEAIAHQTQVFMDEVYQQKMLPTIRSYLKLYTTLPLNKLTTFMCSGKSSDGKTFEMDKDALIINLLCFKHKMKNTVSTKGVIGLEGKFQSGSELDFYIDHDMIHIADTKVAHRYGDFFIRRILKFEDLSRKLHGIKI